MKNTKKTDPSAGQTQKKTEAPGSGDVRQCPRCGHRFIGAPTCPRCGYNGYFPMSEERIKRVKWILYPILLVAAVVVYFLVVKRNGG